MHALQVHTLEISSSTATVLLSVYGVEIIFFEAGSKNQRSSLIIFPVLFYSAYPYKNYCLKCFTELQTLLIIIYIYLNINYFFYLYFVIWRGGGNFMYNNIIV